MSKAWEVLKAAGAWAAWLPVAYYDFVKNHPGRAAILWPVTLALSIWWF
jgi:hypothetical protein